MSTVGTISGSLATTLSFCGGKKWMTRLGRNGISRSGAGRADGERLEEVSWAAHDVRLGTPTRCGCNAAVVRDVDAILFDAGGILVLPDPTVLGPLLAYYGGDPSIERHHRAHYRAMAVKSAAGQRRDVLGRVRPRLRRGRRRRRAQTVTRPRSRSAAHATRTCGGGRSPRASRALRALHDAGMPIGVVSNASGQIEEVLRRSGVCQVGPGPGVPVRVIIDSHVVGVAKPDPLIFEAALGHFEGIDREPDRVSRRLGDDGHRRRAGGRSAPGPARSRTTTTPAPTSRASGR